MVVNETLPVLSENVLGGGLQAVVVSTVLIVVYVSHLDATTPDRLTPTLAFSFSEIIPQSLCSRFGESYPIFSYKPCS